MRSSILAGLALALASTSSFALEKRVEDSLRRLEPETRFHQLCDIETMRRIQAEGGRLHPDRMVMDAQRDVDLRGDTITGTGAAIRSAGQWYRLSFVCRASPDRMKILELNYRVGSAIPQEDWETYGLWR